MDHPDHYPDHLQDSIYDGGHGFPPFDLFPSIEIWMHIIQIYDSGECDRGTEAVGGTTDLRQAFSWGAGGDARWGGILPNDDQVRNEADYDSILYILTVHHKLCQVSLLSPDGSAR